MDLINREVQEVRKHRGQPSVADRVAFEVAEAEVGREAAFPHRRLHRAIEDVHEAPGILPVGIAAHRRLIDRDLPATRRHQAFQFRADKRHEGLRDRIPVGILEIRNQAAAHGVGTGNAGLQHRALRRQPLQTRKLLDRPESAGGADFSGDRMLSPLIMRRRPPPAG